MANNDERDEMTNVDARLLEMLNATRAPEMESDYAREIGATVHRTPVVRRSSIEGMVASQESDAWCRENPELCYGRGPTGRLRNFRAMNDAKLADTYATVRYERNDATAEQALFAEMQERGLL